ncbi:MAG: uncharacterized protein QOE22_43 [Candidatus Parcubacteria bacterium]|jgi:uncharacterized membrane protein YfcA|nr:uncharacterized protein [Candidatus Parcubacteria bacterium]
MELLGFLAIIALAAILQGITGFGFALIAAPLALLFVDKSAAVVALTFVSIALNALLLWRVRGAIDLRQFRTLFIASLFGLPIGLAILKTIDLHTLRVLVGGVSVLFAFLLYRKVRLAVRSGHAVTLAGFLSGVLHTSMSMSGPPVALLLAGRDTEKNAARRTFAAFFLAMSLFSVLLFAATRTLNQDNLTLGLWGIPAALFGGYIGVRFAHKVSQRQFTALVLALVCASGIITIYSGLMK